MLDGSDVTANFVHVPSNIFEVGFQLGHTWFHINCSSGLLEIGLVIRATFGEGGDRIHWFSGFTAWHGNIHLLLQTCSCNICPLSNCYKPLSNLSLHARPCVVELMIDTAGTR